MNTSWSTTISAVIRITHSLSTGSSSGLLVPIHLQKAFTVSKSLLRQSIQIEFFFKLSKHTTPVQVLELISYWYAKEQLVSISLYIIIILLKEDRKIQHLTITSASIPLTSEWLARHTASMALVLSVFTHANLRQQNIQVTFSNTMEPRYSESV